MLADDGILKTITIVVVFNLIKVAPECSEPNYQLIGFIVKWLMPKKYPGLEDDILPINNLFLLRLDFCYIYIYLYMGDAPMIDALTLL